MARYLITGGAGCLGINLTRHLLARECEVTSLDVAAFDYPERDRVRVVDGDIRDRAAVADAMEAADVVIHCAAALPLYSKEDIFSTDVDGTRNVIDEAARRGVERFVQVSSTAVYGIPDHHPIYEDDKMVGVGPYGEAKIQAEQVCLEYRGRGMCVPIVRPKSFVGPERLGVFALFYDWAKDGRGFPMIGRGKNRYQLLDVEDLCEAIWLMATGSRESVNDTFNIGAKEFTTMKEDFQAVLDCAGHVKRIVTFRECPVFAVLRVLEFLGLSAIYKCFYDTAWTDSFVGTDKAERVLGFVPKYSNKDALVRNFQWYLANLHAFAGASGISHRVPWKQGILKVFKWFF